MYAFTIEKSWPIHYKKGPSNFSDMGPWAHTLLFLGNTLLIRACDEERWRTHTEESVEGGYTREKEERTTENKMERRVSTIFEKYWTESGRGDGQGDVEKKDHQLYRRPYMMGKARGKEE